MKNASGDSGKAINSGSEISIRAAHAAPLAVPLAVPKTQNQLAAETDRHLLLIRLSDAAEKIRKETELIQRTSFNDPAGRLLRILAETIEEQRVSFGAVRGEKK